MALTKITNVRTNLQYLRTACTCLIQCVCSSFQLYPTSKRHVLCEVKLATRQTKMSAISVAAWLLSAVAFAAINNGELHYKTLIAWIRNYNGRKLKPLVNFRVSRTCNMLRNIFLFLAERLTNHFNHLQ